MLLKPGEENLECINLLKTKFQLNYRCSNSLSGSLKLYPRLHVQHTHTYLSPLPISALYHQYPTLSQFFECPLNLSHLCFLLPILFLPFCSTTSYYFFITCEDITSSSKPSFTFPGCILQSLDACSYYCCNIYASSRRRQVY